MIRLNRIWKLYIIYTVVIVVCMIVGGLILRGKLKEPLKGHLAHEVLTLARVIGKTFRTPRMPLFWIRFVRSTGKLPVFV